MPKYSLNDIKASFEQKRSYDKQFPLTNYIGRPLSFYAAYLVIRLTESPAKVACFGLLIGLLGNASFLFLDKWGIYPGIILLMLCAVSDAVDGNIARTTKSVTYFGKYFDSILGALVEASYPFFLGLGLYLYYDTSIYLNPFGLYEPDLKLLVLVCGAAITALLLFSNRVGETYEYQRIQSESDKGKFKADLTARIGTSRYSGNILYLAYINMHSFFLQLNVLLALALLNAVDVFMMLFAAYYAGRLLFVFAYYTKKAHSQLR